MAEVIYKSRFAWAVLWHSENKLDGLRRWLDGTVEHPSKVRLFDTRADARTFIGEKYGYIRDRRDLRTEPHGWRMPKAVRVHIRVEVV